VVSVGQVGGVDVCLADEELLLLVAQGIPALQKIVGQWRQLRVRWNYAQALLVGEDLVAQRIPTLVEQVRKARCSRRQTLRTAGVSRGKSLSKSPAG